MSPYLFLGEKLFAHRALRNGHFAQHTVRIKKFKKLMHN